MEEVSRCLFIAAREGQADEVRELLAQGADPNSLHEGAYDHGAFLHRVTPLMTAVGSPRSNAATVQALLEGGADPFAVGSGELTALWFAAGGGTGYALTPENTADMAPDHPYWNWGGGDVERLRMLLDAGLPADETSDNGRSAFGEACSLGDFSRATLLVERGASVWPAKSRADYPEPEFMRTLPEDLRKDLAPDSSGFSSYSVPLFKAAEAGDLDLVRFILDHGFPFDFTCDGNNALNYAGSVEVAEHFLDLGLTLKEGRFGFDSVDDLFEADRNEVAMAVLNRIPDPRVRKSQIQLKLLMCSGVRMNPKAIRLLLAAGADANLPDKGYGSPLHYACWQGDGNCGRENVVVEETVRTLLEAGADPNLLARGLRPLHEAVHGDWGSPTSVRVLLEFGAEVDALDEHRQTPLMVAAQWGELECIKLLLNAGADPKPALRAAKDHLKVWQGIAREPLKKVVKFLAKFSLAGDPEEHRRHQLETLAIAEECYRVLEEASRARQIQHRCD